MTGQGGLPTSKPLFEYPDGTYYLDTMIDGVQGIIVNTIHNTQSQRLEIEVNIADGTSNVYYYDNGSVQLQPGKYSDEFAALVIQALNDAYNLPSGWIFVNSGADEKITAPTVSESISFD